MISDHIHAFLLGLALSLSALSFLTWAWLSGLFKDPEQAKERAYEIETGESAQSRPGSPGKIRRAGEEG